MRYHLTLKSHNTKTGPIPVSTTSSDSCPRTCGMWDACYAKQGPMRAHWMSVDSGRSLTHGTAYGMGLRAFLKAIRALPMGQLWRHNQAGDLPGKDTAIDTGALDALVEANRGKRGFTYTHKPMLEGQGKTEQYLLNRAAVARANREGFTVNLSADTLAQADKLATLGIAPVVVALPTSMDSNTTTPSGRKVVICPAITREGVTCASCKLCAWREREVIIGFPAHGARRGLITLEGQSN